MANYSAPSHFDYPDPLQQSLHDADAGLRSFGGDWGARTGKSDEHGCQSHDRSAAEAFCLYLGGKVLLGPLFSPVTALPLS